ncbi:hypothetical protein [Bathymodiolus japonicus methanotrophic gill symbiont]|uniref:hypothetical protein n=1 Tax=Bathymodiolus japonicus methanotrophic gill symbiont TaxID=113269 RepID=UPI001C8F0916|nr:hypothetical protein [Bathymodiolus japonicus methanotrophic gill symbiont]
MPAYNVLQKGFINGMLYYPEHPERHTLVTRVKFKNPPDWLELITDKKKITKALKENDDLSDLQEDLKAGVKISGDGIETL